MAFNQLVVGSNPTRPTIFMVGCETRNQAIQAVPLVTQTSGTSKATFLDDVHMKSPLPVTVSGLFVLAV